MKRTRRKAGLFASVERRGQAHSYENPQARRAAGDSVGLHSLVPMLYAVGMTYTNDCLNDSQDAALNEWFARTGYANAEEWAADSDYHEVDGIWYDEHGSECDPETQAWWAMEAAASADDEDAIAALEMFDY